MPPITTAESQEQQQQSSSLTSTFLKERRFKLSRACDRCRRRRIKCDEGHPCQACLTANSSCTFEEPGKRTHPHKSKRTATLEDRMHHLETLIQAIPPAVFAAGDTNPSPVPPFLFPQFPAPGVPPPSLHVFPLTNPSTHFVASQDDDQHHQISPDQFAEDASYMSLAASYLYFDDEGYTRWQGETSGLPVLSLLVEQHKPVSNGDNNSGLPFDPSRSNGLANAMDMDWFPNRTPRRTDVNPQKLWRLITSFIVPDLMDSLVQCYLSTSYYILPFLHVPTFLADYGNPDKWSEPGFAAFIVAICCLASRHIDDPRVRANPNDGISAGTQWFELYGRLRSLPIADRPTLYNIQAALVAGIYAVGLGKLSKAPSLFAEAVTMSIDTGLHRCADSYDLFDSIEDEVRKRTFWCVYIWDKQLGAHFGRPPLIRLRDCDVQEPAPVDDEFITRDGVGTPPPGTECRLGAFICSIRIMVVLESVLNVPPVRCPGDGSSFLFRATHVLSASRRMKEMREEEALLDEVHRSIPAYWTHSAETLASEDTIRLTQAERLHCAEQFVRLLIYRHRFTELMVERTNGNMDELPSELEKEALRAAQNSALQIITAHLHVAKKGLMTYYGVHVIHQLTQAGRTLVAILLSCKTEDLQHLIPTGLDALRSCVGLLRRFSGRYVCGLRSGDLMEEFCRLTQIPLETSQNRETPPVCNRPPWIRPVRRKATSVPRSSRSTRSTHSASPPHHSSPESFTTPDFFSESQSKNGQQRSFTPAPSHLQGMTPPPHPSQGCLPQSQPYGAGGDRSQALSFVDSPGMGIDLIKEDSQMYMSPVEMMGLFDDGVDAQLLFSNGYGVIPTHQHQQQQQQQQQQQHHQGGGLGFDNSTFLKHEGLITSP